MHRHGASTAIQTFLISHPDHVVSMKYASTQGKFEKSLVSFSLASFLLSIETEPFNDRRRKAEPQPKSIATRPQTIMGFFGRSKKKDSFESQRAYGQRAQSTYDLSSDRRRYRDGDYPVDHRQQYQYQQYGTPPAPPGWMLAPPYMQPQQQPILIQNNYVLAPPTAQQNGKVGKKVSKLASASVANIPSFLQGDLPNFIPGAQLFNSGVAEWQREGVQYMNQGAALTDLISSRFDSVLTLMDSDKFGRDEEELTELNVTEQGQEPVPVTRDRDLKTSRNASTRAIDRGPQGLGKAIATTDVFTKWKLYSNSMVSESLTPVKFYTSTLPLLCIAAQYSDRVYHTPKGQERHEHIPPNVRLGTKAMVIKSVPVDAQDVIVFAIRGSARFMDWAVNMNQTPASPAGFLDDAGNLCHAGFLDVARNMIKPVAARLRHLLQEDPSRSRCSLLITGHSAGGAIAALLYSHMLSSSRGADSDLRALAGFFKRIHCITFGSPPISLLPLQKPQTPELRKSLFLSFINEGDPVSRASIAYVQSLLNLYLTPPPMVTSSQARSAQKPMPKSILKNSKAASSSTLAVNDYRPPLPSRSKSAPEGASPRWRVPNATLSNGGKLILLRAVPRKMDYKSTQSGRGDVIQARLVSDEQLRSVIFGEMVAHSMSTYLKRINILATNAITMR
ncbi:hypothetical protein V495_04073 [Pseudogymnoascus sp. VKM F-4514 (FW-929)]|nr:hypothetical protein V495_04073 [Pseudogymnoascus sp. VKM F-4514 (FW-929)]KFY57854.1 hypothetical protein V497_05258 [Pseudogymnoascus sp. VKM F-4516 (FW-969)]